VLIEDHGVILRGHANCEFVRSRAAEAAQRLAGVPVVANEITVT
jgi:osmotically-inducible protein OsmY